ncbi:Hypothetical predicted protein [Mytilus galloprovincialis]|uniref:Uncharacterized protein n=1 Tax=Mytilus galloprovincialis TaxID=29158 RepID=A0A8B6ECZ1_MYTGA|nr:Hypothetical predicted protein [Mytilus galloprovincialis]
MNNLIHNKVKHVRSITSTLQDYKIGVEIHKGITSLLENVDRFGKIKVEENTFSLPFKDAKVDQAQIVHIPTGQSFDRTSLQLRQKFQIKDKNNYTNLRGCWILPKSHLLIADYYGDKVIMEYKDDGRHIRDIPVSDQPFDLAIIDSDRIAVSYFGNNMEILNINNKTVLAKVSFESGCYGISYQNGNIYISVVHEGIVEMDVSGKRLRTIGGKYAKGGMYHLTTTHDRIYCTNIDQNLVYCCSMMGEDIWTFTNQSLNDPRGISADGDQNVFVVGLSSNNLMMIQHDGKDSKMLLSKSDGLNKPVSVHYNRDKKLLLVCNVKGDAFLYSVI